MIGRLTGRAIECRPERVVLDVGGVGYELLVPLGTYYRIARGEREATCTLHIHTHVREDALALFGFATRDERATFEQLISIGGVGPRLAIAILSGIGVDELWSTVATRDRDRLQRIPGVGKKTAERLLLELSDKQQAARKAAEVAAAGDAADPASVDGTLESDAISALLNLGYPRERARKAVADAVAAPEAAGDDGAPSLERVLRGALSRLVS